MNLQWLPDFDTPTSLQRVFAKLNGICAYLVGNIAGERNPASATNSFLSTKQEWNYTPYNPRAASTGSSKGAAGTAGNVEVLIGAGVPVFVGGIITEDDTVAGSVLLRDAAATGTNVSARALASVLNTVSQYPLELMFNTGLTVCGTAAGVSCIIKWRPQA